MIRLYLLTCLLLASTSAWSGKINHRGIDRTADEVYHYLYLSAGAGGGDVIYNVADGPDLRAGGGLHAAYGFRFTNDEAESVVIDIKLGAKLSIAEEGKLSFWRFPVDLELQTRINEDFGLGFGITYHFKPKLIDDTGPSVVTSDVEPGIGSYVSLEYRISNDFSIGSRYTSINYEDEGVYDIDGSSTEIFALIRFY